MGRTLFSIYIWFGYGVSFALSLIFTTVVFLFTFPFDPHRKAPNAVMMFFGQWMVRLNPFWKIHVFGREKLLEKPFDRIVLANHQSFMDMPLLATLPVNMKWVSKKEMFRIPVAGWLMSMCGHISVERGSKKAARSLDNVDKPVKAGVPVMIFPEGTRSRDGNMRDSFRKGAFHAAKRFGLTLQPIVLEGTHNAFPPDGWRLNSTGNMYISVLDPIHPDDFESVDELTEHTYDVIKKEWLRLKELPA